jgi:CRP/FNR family transcriptional regulator
VELPSFIEGGPMELEESLRAVPLLQPLDKERIEQLVKAATRRSYAPGEVIVRQGDSGIALYIILFGAVKVTRKASPTATEDTLATLRQGEFFGEMALLDDFPRSATVTAIEPTECLLLTAWEFRALLKTHPEMALAILPLLSRRLRASERMVCE